MSERIVISLRMNEAGIASGRGYLARARVVAQRAEVLGGALMSFGADAVAFVLEPDAAEEAMGLAQLAASELAVGETAWSCGIAQGKIEAFAPTERADLAWGEPLVIADLLARAAKPGEALVHDSVSALKANDLLLIGGSRFARWNGKKIRGVRLDVRQPWRRAAEAQAEKLELASLVGRDDPASLLAMPGALALLRADPGMGGTRLLMEVSNLAAPGPSLMLVPTGSGLEPLGSLRRALSRAMAVDERAIGDEASVAMKRLFAGDGVNVETAASLIVAYLKPEGDAHGVLLIDDAADVDSASLEACARAIAISNESFPLIARLDAAAAIPSLLASVRPGPEVELKPFNLEEAARVAEECTGGAMTREARERWARRGSFAPLGIIESIATGIASGELSWVGNRAAPRRRSSGKGKVWPASYWIAQRAARIKRDAQHILAVVTLMGGEGKASIVEDVLRAANISIEVHDEVPRLIAGRWLQETEPGWIALPTRTHREAILGELMDEATRKLFHRALVQVMIASERGLRVAEVAHHAARAGDGALAAKLALTSARTASNVGLEQGVVQLIGFARERDPNCDAEALKQLASSLPKTRAATNYAAGKQGVEAPLAGNVVAQPGVRIKPSIAPQALTPPTTYSLPPPVEQMAALSLVEAAEEIVEAASVRGEEPDETATGATRNLGARLTELAKEALLGADASALDRWSEGLRATGEHGRFAERMQAMARLTRGDVGDALRVLKSARTELDSGSPEAKCQASLALGVGLSMAGRPDEALLEGLDALARARESADEKPQLACLAFLAKLFASMSRADEASRLRAVAKVPEVSASA